MSNSYAVDEKSTSSTTVVGDSMGDSICTNDCHHRVERDVTRRLLANPGLRFSSLVVRRIADGVCLEGVLEVDDDRPDVCSVVRQVAGVQNVLNHLVLRQAARTPVKG